MGSDGPYDHVLDRGPQVLRYVAMATRTQFAITGFVGYNFGCMIGIATRLFESRGGFSGSSYPMTT